MREYNLIARGDDSTQIIAPGDYVRVESTLYPVRVENPDNAHTVTLDEGEGVKMLAFNRLHLSCPDAPGNTPITLLIGRGIEKFSAKVGGGLSVVQVRGFSIGTTSATVGAVSALLMPVDVLRKTMTIKNTSTTATVYISGTAPATTSSFPILPGEAIPLEYSPGSELYAIATGGTAIVAIMWEYD